MIARLSCRRLLLSGFATRRHAMRDRCSHVIASIAYCPRVGPPIVRDVWSVLAHHRFRRLSLTDSTPCRRRCVVFVCVIAVIAYYGRVSGPVATTIAVRNDHTDCPRIWPAFESNVRSGLSRHRCHRLSLTGSTPCHARCVVLVRTSSL